MKNMPKNTTDPFIGVQPTSDYTITEWVGEGEIGTVYKAERDNPHHILACKIIKEGKLKDGWQRELEKVVKLGGVPSVVQYHSHGDSKNDLDNSYTWVLWQFIDGRNLKKYIEEHSGPLDIAFIENLTETILKVLHACQAVQIQHGDLHEGNILISNPDPRLIGEYPGIWIADFGYGGSHNHLSPKDDYRQLFAIISNLLKKLDSASLNPRDKAVHQKMDEFLKKKILEVDSTQGGHVNNPENLLREFEKSIKEAERESAAAARGREIKEPGDYLSAEALGHRIEEWKNLFVSELPAAHDLLSKNITVLTGARGCGKTMSFRRLTAFMDKVIGEPSGIKGADQFIGFYLNCRDLIDAFPWLPPVLNTKIQQQIIHYFHLAWFSEITKTLAQYEIDTQESFNWLDELTKGIFRENYSSLPIGANVLTHVRAFIEDEKERCRLTDLGRKGGLKYWPLSKLEFLDILQEKIQLNVSWIYNRPSFFFLDDYTIPILTREVQRALNPIIFKRRSNLFFKISTESSNSFEREGLHGKPLELRQDFEFIDLASDNIHLDNKDKQNLLSKIFKPRIDRHEHLQGEKLDLVNILGKMDVSNNELARQMREKPRKTIYYYGIQSFVGIWTSDIRTMIQIFMNMLRDANGKLKKGSLPIEKTVQDKCYKNAGGEFLGFAESVKDPSFWEKGPSSTKRGEPYGTHLKDIVETFVKVSRYELTEGKLVSNQGRMNPKQSFRLEVIDSLDLSKDALNYYQGIVRWHIFLQDWRGKSVRGMMTPRLYLNRMLIPHSNLTFSSHDNLQLTSKEFIELLTNPKTFFPYWKNKKKRKNSALPNQKKLF